jgi:hypothetical protein
VVSNLDLGNKDKVRILVEKLNKHIGLLSEDADFEKGDSPRL